MLIIGFLLFIATFSYGQFSIPTSETFDYDLLKSPQKLNIESKNGSLHYLKPEHSYHPTLGNFCVLENKIAKKTIFPVKMRLGSVDYVDKLENKRN